MKIEDLKRTVDMLAERYPNATVNFLYPVQYRGKRRAKLGHQTGFIANESVIGAWIRFRIEHAPDSDGSLLSDAEEGA